MDGKTPVQRAPHAASAVMDHSEELLAEVDEPPDELRWSPIKLPFGYMKSHPSMQRRESLLTRQLHSETEHTDEEHIHPGRAMSTQSTWSTQSATSMTELTSDDGHSVPSPVVSPPLAPTHSLSTVPSHEKTLEQKVNIAGLDDAVPQEPSQEQKVEADLGRKRCISFACRGKQESKPAPPPTSQPVKAEPTSPLKRKCMLKFACPTKTSATKTAETTQVKRAASPPPPVRRSASKTKHRGSDSTVTHASPKSVRKPSPVASVPEKLRPTTTRKYSNDSDDDTGNEATRFHEFATSEEEPDAWCQESTCHRTRLTVDDTLKKENIIRKTCEEVEEEVLEEEEEEEEEEMREDLGEAGDDEDVPEDEESDAGFHSDDEGGFASSDSERDDDSDYEWWRPGGASTAATSVEHLDRLAIVNSQPIEPGSSVNSASSSHVSPRSSRVNMRKTTPKSTNTQAISINRPPSPELPDSTDFVCGTLDEDRPMEQAYLNRKKAQDAAKRPSRPQDIDPSFPTSDPEMDEEDDDDVDEVAESDGDEMMHGALDELDEPSFKRFSPPRRRGRISTHRSPPPPTRLHHSPAPKRTSNARSPPPPKRARSPPPRKLFGNSPRRVKSPAPLRRMTSPANSPTGHVVPLSTAPRGLAGRPQPTHTASVPRNGPVTISRLAHWGGVGEESEAGLATEIPRRGAIDIVKGVEFKRQRRKEKLHQKMCAKHAMKAEKTHKVKPGKGAERMREVGLQLQNYRGKAEHILSL